jgi:hypothetical protein
MNTNTDNARNDEQYYYDTLTRKNTQPKRYFNWVPLLLIPLFFVLGWVTKGAYDSPNNSINSPQYGVGGGPGDVTPYSTGRVAPVSSSAASPVTATISPATHIDEDGDEEVVDTPSPTPSPKTTPRVSPSVTPEE